MLLEVIIIGLNIGYLTSDTEDNELYTPAFAVDPIIKYLPKDKIMWLPFDDEWSMFYQRLTEEGFKVIRSSLSEGKDFFEYEPDTWDFIVSNPPFSVKDKVLERLYSFNKPFAVLLPLNSFKVKQDTNILARAFSSSVLMQEFLIMTENIWISRLRGVHLQRHTFVEMYYQGI